MKFRTLSLFAFSALVVALPGCHQKTTAEAPKIPMIDPMAKPRTHETSRLSAAVDAYVGKQNPENDAAVRQAMADVDSEIAELSDLVAQRHGRDREKVAVRLRFLEASRSEETTRFAAIQAGTALATPDPRGGGTSAGQAGGTAAPASLPSEETPEQTGGVAKDTGR